MPLSVKPRKNGVYYIRGTVQGRRFDQSAKTRDRGEAQAIAEKLASEAFQRRVYGDRGVATFMEAVEGYLAAGGDPTHLDPLLVEFGAKPLSKVTQRAIDDYAAKRLGAAPATLVRQIYTPMAAVLNFAASPAGGRLCDRPELRKPTVKNNRTDYLTPDVAEAWIKGLPAHLSSLVTFYLATGCRATEALQLEWKDVALGNSRAVFWDTKGGYARSVELQRRAQAILPERAEGVIFRNSKGEPWHAYDAVNLMLKRYAPKLGLPPVHLHLFRHTWATWAYACTRDLTFLMQHGGWRSLSMVERYTHLGSPALATAVISHSWEFHGREIPGLKSKRRKPQ